MAQRSNILLIVTDQQRADSPGNAVILVHVSRHQSCMTVSCIGIGLSELVAGGRG